MKRIPRFLAVAGVSAMGVMALAGTAGAAGTINATPNTGLANNQAVTVSGTLPANSDFVISQCNDTFAGVAFDPIVDCDNVSAVLSLDPTPTGGTYSETFTVWTGVRNGFACDSANPCRLRINTGVFGGQADQAFATITFAAPTTTTTAPTTTTTAPTTTTTASTTTTTAPDPVVPEAPYAVLLPLGGAAVLGAAYMLVRRGRAAV